MALNSYANLKSSVSRWADNDDLGDVIDDCIQLCESEIFSTGEYSLRVREMEKEATSELNGSDELELPDDFLESREFSTIYHGCKYIFEYATPESLPYSNLSGMPSRYTITDRIRFNRPSSEPVTIKMVYRCSLPGLSSSNNTNAILSKYPTIYLYGCVAKALQFSGDLDEHSLWQIKFHNAILSANKSDSDSRYGVAPQIPIVGGIV